jgi:hypothetical protein
LPFVVFNAVSRVWLAHHCVAWDFEDNSNVFDCNAIRNSAMSDEVCHGRYWLDKGTEHYGSLGAMRLSGIQGALSNAPYSYK